LTIGPTSTLVDVAFAVCSALDARGLVAVLTGGSAATFYAPDAYQSQDVDFVLQFGTDRKGGAESLRSLGYSDRGQTWFHKANPFTVQFPAGPLAIGDDLVKVWDTVRRDRSLLYVLTPTDSVRDRLMWFYLQPTDRSSLDAALSVARRTAVDIDAIRDWSARDGFAEKFAEFELYLKRT
jgi:hypothetical protein